MRVVLGTAGRWVAGAVTLLVAVQPACTRGGNDSFLGTSEQRCTTAATGAPDQPAYEPTVRQILDQACATCHGDVLRYGAPPGLLLGGYDDVFEPRTGSLFLGAASAAPCICVAAVQANPASPLRMPLGDHGGPLCASDRETLRRWVSQGAPRQGPDGGDGAICLQREDLDCLTRDGVPEVPTFADIEPIVSSRCNTCHAAGGCFGSPSQTHFRLDRESDVRLGCEGGAEPVDGGCPGGAARRVVDRGVGLFEMRGEVLRTAVLQLDESTNLVPPMPLRPWYAGVRRDLLPRLCDNDRETLRRWIASGRRTGSDRPLEPECVSEEVPARPTWRLDVRRILAGRCGLCHGAHNRAGLSPAFRLDRYTNEGDGSPGAVDLISWCAEAIDPGATTLMPFPATGAAYPIENGAIEVGGRRFALRDGPCEPGGAGAKHTRLDLRVMDLVRLLAVDTSGMPPGIDEGTRAPLCGTDRAVLLRWEEVGLPYE